MKKILSILLLSTIVACNNEPTTEKKIIVSLPSTNSDTVNNVFAKVLASYYSLKDNFIKENDTLINQSAQKLALQIVLLDSLQTNVDSLKQTKLIELSANINSEIKGLLGEKMIEEKRKSFQMLGNQLYDLIKLMNYNKETIYHQYCPMAFKDTIGAAWLSNVADIKNPYLPKKMLTCGEVTDTLNFNQ